jgi:hypothetical protein
MALPTNADVIVVHGYWLDELTGAGVKQVNGLPATIMFDPVPLLGANAAKTPNLRDLTSNAHLKTRTRVASVDPVTGYYAAQLVASNDPDLDAYSGRKVTFLGEDPFTIEVPYNAPTVTVSAEMAAKTGLTQGSSVKAIWLPNASVTTIPTPTPSVNYLSSSQTLANIASGIETHDEDPDAHADIRALIPVAYTDEQARDTLAAALVAGSNVTITPNDGGDTITISVSVPSSYSDEQAQDAFAALVAAGTHSGISFTYNDAGNAISATVAAQSWSQITGKPTFAAVATSGSASDITTGTLPDGVIPSGIARDTEVATAVANLVNSAPTTLDTLGEIATALQADESAAAALTTTVAGKASQSSVDALAATIPPGWTQTAAKAAGYTAAAYEIVVIDTSSGTFTVTGPTNGKPFGFRWKAGTAAPTIAAPSGYTISGVATVTPGLAPSTSSGELVLWQAFSGDYQPVGGQKPQSALNAANDVRYPSKTAVGVVLVDEQIGATDDARFQAAVTSATAAISAGSGAVTVRFSGRAYSWTGSIPTLPCNLARKLIIDGNGSKVTLSSTAAAFAAINKVTDYDVFRNVDIRDLDINANNVAGYGHAIIGTATYSTSTNSTLTRIGVDQVSVRRVKVTNLPTDWSGADFRSGVYLMAGLTGAAGEAGVSVTNVVVEDVQIYGGRFGVAIGARFTTSANVYVNDCHINRCYHDTGATPTVFLGCTNFFLGARGHGGYGSITNCHGKNSGDDGVEFNGLENVLVDNCLIEDAANVAYLHNNFAAATIGKSQKLKIRDSHARVVNLASSSTMPGRGFLLNTATVASTTTTSVSSGATTIPLTSVTPNVSNNDIYFPAVGTVTDGTQTITYTGISGTTLTGVSGVTSTIASGATITVVNDVQAASIEGCSLYKQGQTYWEYTGDAVKVSGPIRHLSIREFDYIALGWAAVISAASTPAAFYINATPTETGADSLIRLDNIRLRLTGSRVSGSTADWIGFDVSGSEPHLVATSLEIDNAMTGMSAINNVEGLRLGRASNAVGGSCSAVVKGMKVRSLGDVGSVQKGIHTGTQTALGNNPLFDFSGLDFGGLLTGAQDVTSDSGGFVKYRTFVEHIITKTGGRASPVNITPTTGTFQYQNSQQRRGTVVVQGGTVSQIQIGSSTGTLFTTGLTAGVFPLDPGDVLQVVNTVAPTMTFVPAQ